MAKVILFAVLALTTFAMNPPALQDDGNKTGMLLHLEEFIAGFINGVQEDPNSPTTCGGDVEKAWKETYAAIPELQAAFRGDLTELKPFIAAVDAIYAEFMSHISVDCKSEIEALGPKLNDVFGESGGWKLITERFAEHIFSVWGKIDDVKSCTSNFSSCGTASGTLFRWFIDWSL
jgi:hypothetical protein